MIMQEEDDEEHVEVDEIPKMTREKEFFYYHPMAFADDIHEAVHEIIAVDGADYVDQCLLTHSAFQATHVAERVAEGTDQMWHLLDDCFGKNLDKFEQFLMTNVFNIPNDLVLPSEMPSLNYLMPVDSQSLKEQAHKLNQDLEEMSTNFTKLQQEMAEKRRLKQDLENEIKLVESWDVPLSISESMIEKDIVPLINNINHKSKEIEYSYNLMKQRLADHDIKLDVPDNKLTDHQLCNNINNLTLEEYIRDKQYIETKTKELNTIQQGL
ncbi:hypothetical protein SAMD00019534_031160 [Acytostelium subglobosum LB1]|uniref:hypothetical protein n=1 Tax=Acytostelium subglobosum LB1 TaxID=1410327 RepID=UPI000644AE67|nr:hypothetical protein SAMD00019534_031160 [Acytostelium subglobosum LB1]GAM19941.1 hypothetical protein SAMD00019534_031160 [Acytostelium subglobosum LB1]|eukprot:XP_012756703.1 hypothetical protein SAMD00019534_031160 [Acytostelium subglobosum LB1]